MWFFARKYKLLETPFFEGFKDFHNHTLPNVDDGVSEMSESLAVLSHFEELKISEVVLTPHVMVGVNEASTAVEEAYAKLRATYTGPIKLSLASEYMLDTNFLARLNEGVRHLGDSCLLVETSYFSAPRNLNQLLYEVLSEAITPVVAHAERYSYMQRAQYHSLRERGCAFQLNLLSLSNVYGKRVTDNALYMLENDMYDIAGTDLHSLKSFKLNIAKVSLSSKHIDKLMELKERGL